MIRWAAGRPAVIWAVGAALILAGGVAFTKLPLATRTAVELPRLRVSAAWFGASPELVESYVTSPIEEVIQGVRGVKKVSSESRDGASSLTVELEPKADVTLARLEINERLELLRSRFPIGVSGPSVANYTPEELEEQPLLTYSIIGPYTAGTLTKITRDQVVPRITAVPGVAGVTLSGTAEPGVAVVYEPLRLRQLGINPTLLRQAIAGARTVEALGRERRGANVVTVALRDQPNALEDLGQLVIRAPSGRVFRLDELATIRPDEDNRGRFARINGVPTVTLQLSRLAGADAIRTASQIKTTMDGIRRILPEGITFRIENDESRELQEQLNDLLLRGAIAFAAVMLVLAVMLRNFTSVWLVMGSAAVAIAGTALGLYILDIPANLLTLAGLAMGIGVLAQNGLVVVERLRHAPDTPDGRAAAGRRITPAVVGASLTTAVVLLPFLYLQGNARAAFLPFAAAFLLALAWSVISAVVMIPAVGAGHGMNRTTYRRTLRLFTRSVIGTVRWRPITIGLTVIALGTLTWGFIKQVPKSSFGNWFGQRSELFVGITFPHGSDPRSVDLAMQEFERIAVGRHGVDRVEAAGFPMMGRLRVTFTRAESYGIIPALMEEEMTQRAVFVGGAAISVRGRGPGFFSGGGGSSVAFRIKLLGYSFSGVEQLARDLQTRLERIPRVRDVNINAGAYFRSERTVSVALTPDRPALARAGLTTSDFRQAIAREVQGGSDGQRLELEGDEVTVNVKARGAQERALDDLRDAIIPNDVQAPVRIGDLSVVSEREGLNAISREDQQYVRIVSYDFRGPPRLAQRTHESFMNSISVPAGYTVDDERFEWADDDSTKGLWLVLALGLTLVVLSVAIVFNSAWAAMLVFASLPLALAGVAAIFWATGTSFGREAAVGVILVIGLATNQAILLVDGALERRRRAQAEGRRLSAADIVYAARDRSAMIMLVTLTTMASLIPLAVGTDVDSLFGSIALATAGGTLTGTVGSLWILPAMLLGKRSQPRRKKARKGRSAGAAPTVQTEGGSA